MKYAARIYRYQTNKTSIHKFDTEQERDDFIARANLEEGVDSVSYCMAGTLQELMQTYPTALICSVTFVSRDSEWLYHNGYIFYSWDCFD